MGMCGVGSDRPCRVAELGSRLVSSPSPCSGGSEVGALWEHRRLSIVIPCRDRRALRGGCLVQIAFCGEASSTHDREML